MCNKEPDSHCQTSCVRCFPLFSLDLDQYPCLTKSKHTKILFAHLNSKRSTFNSYINITSRLDYCNGALWGIADKEIHRLQKIQYASARIVTRTKSTEHISPILRNLHWHWLPVIKRLDFKILCSTYLCMNNIAPHYLSDLIRWFPVMYLKETYVPLIS